jgi:hypothetical protein
MHCCLLSQRFPFDVLKSHPSSYKIAYHYECRLAAACQHVSGLILGQGAAAVIMAKMEAVRGRGWRVYHPPCHLPPVTSSTWILSSVFGDRFVQGPSKRCDSTQSLLPAMLTITKHCGIVVSNASSYWEGSSFRSTSEDHISQDWMAQFPRRLSSSYLLL